MRAQHNGAHSRFNDRRLQEEVTDVLRLVMQHLLPQIVDDVPIGAGETLDELRAVSTISQPQCRKLKTGSPALGALDKTQHILRGERQTERAIEQAGCLLDA